ncbi:helix-turn-helix domain-containing protein [Plantactinospora sp. WMMB334]|uniref:helix-turn-helix domain-containing protein n=1 Tax=Plantactinospora sp. WMMB334 TaxID=3404119 RepID=UPI003B946B2A
MPDTTIGRRLANLRDRRRMSQRRLAETAGVSVDVIRKLEQGQRQAGRLDTLVRLAKALDVPAAELIGKPRGLIVDAENGEVLELRRALLGIGLKPYTDDPPTTDELRVRVADLWRLYWTGRYGLLARHLPPALADARASLRQTPGPAGHAVLAELLQISAALLAHVAYEDLAHVALLHALAEAERAEYPLLRAAQQATLTWLLSRQGLWDEAEHLAVTAAAEVEPAISRATPDQLAVWGELMRYGVTAVARTGRRSEAEEMLGMVTAAASAMAGRRATLAGVLPFGATIAGMAAVGIAVATDEPRRALDLADRVDGLPSAPLAIQARYLLNVAFAQTMDWRSREAVETLRRVDGLAPELLPHQTIARAIVDELLPRRRQQRLPGLVAIAKRVGAEV